MRRQRLIHSLLIESIGFALAAFIDLKVTARKPSTADKSIESMRMSIGILIR
jgi:dGTP triphosphohydrolase